jgi:hypothetical protein
MKSKQMRLSGTAMVLTCALAACAQSSTGSTTVTSATVGGAHPHAAHALLVDTASCWMGGIWGDVQGETPAERAASSERRCEAVVQNVFGKADHTRYLQLRAFEPETLDAINATLGRRALHDPLEARNADALQRLFSKLAAAERETTLARRAAHRITRDFDHEREKLDVEEAFALPELESSLAFSELYRVDAGELGAEAHALTLIVLLDRMRVAEELPVHLKPYVVAEPLRIVFGGTPPTLPHDAARPLERGGWLLYLTDVARQARHPIPNPNAPPLARHEAAVAGILQGIADQLRHDVTVISPESPLHRVTLLTIRALEQSKDRAML